MGRTLVIGCAISSASASTPTTSAGMSSKGKRTQGSSTAITSPCARCPGWASAHLRTSASTSLSPTCHRCSVGFGGLQRWQAPLPHVQAGARPMASWQGQTWMVLRLGPDLSGKHVEKALAACLRTGRCRPHRDCVGA